MVIFLLSIYILDLAWAFWGSDILELGQFWGAILRVILVGDFGGAILVVEFIACWVHLPLPLCDFAVIDCLSLLAT